MSNYTWKNLISDWVTWNGVKNSFATWDTLRNYEAGIDSVNRFEQPVITLKNPNGTSLYMLNTIFNREVSLKFNDIGEFTFSAYKINDMGIPNEYYSYLAVRRLVEIENVGVFVISNVVAIGSGIYEKKEVICQSLEKELARKNVGLLEGTMKLYDPINPTDTLLGKLISLVPDWSIGYVDIDLVPLYRTFDITSDISLYNLLVSDVSKAYQCIFRFNTIDKTINVYTKTSAINKTSILFTYQNLIKQIKIDENSEELCTSLAVFGSDDMSIHKVNPLGTSSIYNFDYYKNTEWMSQSLITAINEWEGKVSSSQGDYNTLLTRYKTETSKLLDLNVQLKELDIELKVLNEQLAIIVAANGETTGVKTKITLKEKEINAKKTAITSQENLIKSLSSQLTSKNNDLKFETNFTKTQLQELSYFMIQNTYTDSSFFITDEMSEKESIEMETTLYDQAKEMLKTLSMPKYTFTIDSVNFMNIPEFKVFKDQFSLGSEITVDLGDDRFAYPVLLEMRYSYDDISKLDLTFSNRLRLSRNVEVFEELFGKTVSISSTIEHESNKWGQGQVANKKIDEILNNAWDASKNNLINAENQEVTMDSTGIRLKKYMPESQTYSPYQLWMTQNTIGFTRDNWDSVCTAIGEIDVNGSKYYGVSSSKIKVTVLEVELC